MFHEEDGPGTHASPFVGHVLIDPPLSPAERDYINRFANTRRVLREQGPYYAYAAPGPLSDLSSDATVIDTNAPAEGQPDLWCPWRITVDGSRIVYPTHGMKSTRPAEWMAYLINHFLRDGAHVMTALPDTERRKLGIPYFPSHVCTGKIQCREHRNIVVENNRVGQEKCYPNGEVEWLPHAAADEPEPFDPLEYLDFRPLPKPWRSSMIERMTSHAPFEEVGPAVDKRPPSRLPRSLEKYMSEHRPPTGSRAGFSALLSFGFRLGTPIGIPFLLENSEEIAAEIGYRGTSALLLAVMSGQNQGVVFDMEARGFTDIIVSDTEARTFAEMLVPGISFTDITDSEDERTGFVSLEIRHLDRMGGDTEYRRRFQTNMSDAIVKAAIEAWGEAK